PPPGSPLFPYTTLFRSVAGRAAPAQPRLRGLEPLAGTAQDARPERRILHGCGVCSRQREPEQAALPPHALDADPTPVLLDDALADRKSTRLNSSHQIIS